MPNTWSPSWSDGRQEPPRLAGRGPTTDTSILTAVGNDFGFDRVFARQIEALGRPGDVAVGITTSGDSPNVLRALETARACGLVTVALTGKSGGAAGRLAESTVNVPETVTAASRKPHTTMLHLVASWSTTSWKARTGAWPKSAPKR